MDRNLEVINSFYTIDNSGIKFSAVHADMHLEQSNGDFYTQRLGVVFTADGILPSYMQNSRRSNLQCYRHEDGIMGWIENTWVIPQRTEEMTDSAYLDIIISEFLAILDDFEASHRAYLNGAPLEFNYD